ncbi:MAG: peptidase [Eubacterium sp.]|nr:peptidase [Eubacterium sp.]
MASKIIKAIKSFFSNRTGILIIVFALTSAILIARLVRLQLIDGEMYSANFTVKTTKTRVLKASRGNIYDANGKLLAYNQLTNSVTIADNGVYETTRQKNLTVNGEIYKMIHLIWENGDVLSSDFHVVIGEDGEYRFDSDDETILNRFRADIYGYPSIEQLSEEERNADADKIMYDLGCENRFGLFNSEEPYTSEELASHGLPEELSKEDSLAITNIRYMLSLISFQRYMSVTVATNVSDETVASIKENADSLPGVDIAEDYIRIYNSSLAMSPIIGYTGKAASSELEELMAQDSRYNNQSVIGKAGVEQSMELELQGVDGSEEVTVDNLGRVLAEDTDSKVEPVQGHDVYLTIDSELQDACYQILEQRIAGIILMFLIDVKSVDLSNVEDIDTVPIPSYDAYFSMFNNDILDIRHFQADDATKREKSVYKKFQKRQDDILLWMRTAFTDKNSPAYDQFSLEQKVYFDYIFDEFLSTTHGILNPDVVDTTDPVYQAYKTDENISPTEFLQYAVNSNWIDLTKLDVENNSYLTTDEIYNAVLDYLEKNLREDKTFEKLLYKYMLLNDIITPREVMMLLYDQGILTNHAGEDEAFLAGNYSAFDLLKSKIQTLEITPAMLALDPCSGSIVITDPETSFVKACVTYPGYDNTQLANTTDTTYYDKVNNDLSTPFYNKATQQSVAPGSTFKPVTACAGLNEGIVNKRTTINCGGLFGVGIVSESDYVNCWLATGHGPQDVEDALGNSCNVYFCTLGYMLGLDNTGTYTQSLALSAIRRYSSYFGLDKKSGIQIPETEPQVSDSLPIPSAMGQGTHLYSTSQLARYVQTIATKGKCYDLSLVEKVTDSEGNIIKYYDPNEISRTDIPDEVWTELFKGMKLAVDYEMIWSNGTYHRIINYGKTGTAQESKVRADHALTVGFTKINPEGIAQDSLDEGKIVYETKTDEEGNEIQEPVEKTYLHYEDHGEIAYAIRVGNGYTSRNTNLIASDVLLYYYGIQSEDAILIGEADTTQMLTMVQNT